jgi:hypothetical protein
MKVVNTNMYSVPAKGTFAKADAPWLMLPNLPVQENVCLFSHKPERAIALLESLMR